MCINLKESIWYLDFVLYYLARVMPYSKTVYKGFVLGHLQKGTKLNLSFNINFGLIPSLKSAELLWIYDGIIGSRIWPLEF